MKFIRHWQARRVKVKGTDSTEKYDGDLSSLLHDNVHWLDVLDTRLTSQCNDVYKTN